MLPTRDEDAGKQLRAAGWMAGIGGMAVAHTSRTCSRQVRDENLLLHLLIGLGFFCRP